MPPSRRGPGRPRKSSRKSVRKSVRKSSRKVVRKSAFSRSLGLPRKYAVETSLQRCKRLFDAKVGQIKPPVGDKAYILLAKLNRCKEGDRTALD